jgi:hypothetical protein
MLMAWPGSGSMLQSSLCKRARLAWKIVHVYHSVVKAINLCS